MFNKQYNIGMADAEAPELQPSIKTALRDSYRRLICAFRLIWGMIRMLRGAAPWMPDYLAELGRGSSVLTI